MDSPTQWEPRVTASNSVHDQNAVLLCFHYCNLLQCRCSRQLLRNPPVRLGPVAAFCCICNASAHNMSMCVLLSGGPCRQYPFLTYSEDCRWLDHLSVNSGNHRRTANGMSEHPLLPIRRLIQAKKNACINSPAELMETAGLGEKNKISSSWNIYHPNI